MRILYYSPHPYLSIHSPAGYATHMKEMIRAFELLGHTVKPFIMGDHLSGNLPSTGGQRGSLVPTLKKWIPKIIWETTKDLQLIRIDQRAASLLTEQVKLFKPDLIYERSNYMQISGVRTASLFGIPHLLEVNSPYVEERVVLGGRSLLVGFAKSREKFQLATCSKVVVVSTALRDYFIKNYPISLDKYLITPNAINIKAIRLSGSDSVSLTHFKWTSGDFVYGFVGSIFKWHGVDLLIQAFDRLRQKHKNVKLLIVGDGAIMNELKHYVADSNLTDLVYFTGSISHDLVFNYIQLMDCTIMAKSNWYGSPIKLFEYGYLAKPVIAPNVSPVRDVLTHKETALLVDPEPNSLVDAMEWILLNREEAKQMGQRFKSKILNEHLWQHNAQAVLSAI